MWLLKKQFTNGLFNVLLVLSAISFRILDKKKVCWIAMFCWLHMLFVSKVQETYFRM